MTLTHKQTISLCIIFSWLFSINTLAQTAEDYFHDGAQTYIGGNLAGAMNQVQDGLLKFPDDPKLNELLETLKEEEQKTQDKDQENQDQQNEDQEKKQEQNNQEQNQNKNDEQEEEKEGEQENQSQENENEDQNKENQQPQPQNAREISKEEAQKILQALAQKEKELLKEFKKLKPQGSTTHDKDW